MPLVVRIYWTVSSFTVEIHVSFPSSDSVTWQSMNEHKCIHLCQGLIGKGLVYHIIHPYESWGCCGRIAPLYYEKVTGKSWFLLTWRPVLSQRSLLFLKWKRAAYFVPKVFRASFSCPSTCQRRRQRVLDLFLSGSHLKAANRGLIAVLSLSAVCAPILRKKNWSWLSI